MAASDPKADLHEYLQTGREVMLWKLDGLAEYDLRRSLVPTGTNLLGLVRHVACTETGYFGLVFGRPFPETLPWMEDGEPNGDMWVRAGETSESVVDFCRRVWAHADATIDALSLDAVGEVPWWPEGAQQISLHQALVHVLADIYRHAGHADILRELIDGVVGADRRWSNLPPGDEGWWESYRNKVEAAARQAGDVT
ncbi:MAG TPA: DinB family protein [Iamia sp.]|nr:DinB family protein [Iamia sp.]